MKKKMKIQPLGCQMNKSDAEWIVGMTRDRYELTDESEAADLVTLTSCSIRQKAIDKLYSALGAIAKRKSKTGRPDLIAVVGCLTRDEAVSMRERAPYVDLIVGSRSLARFNELLDKRIETGQTQVALEADAKLDRAIFQIDEETDLPDRNFATLPLAHQSSVSALIPIMRGCDNDCSYCIVPQTRGEEISRPIEAIVEESHRLADVGYKEIWLLGQNVNSYGASPKTRSGARFPALLRRLAEEVDIDWIRFLTSHPKDLSDELIDVMSERSDKIQPAIHLPLQSGSDEILKKMRRGYTFSDYMRKIEKLRAAIPRIALSSDMIVAFPGETDRDHRASLDAMRQIECDSIFLFKFSARDGTDAATIKPKVNPDTAKRRFDELFALSRKIAAGRARRFHGERVKSLIEKKGDKTLARTTGNLTCSLLGEIPENLLGQIVELELTVDRNGKIIGRIDEKLLRSTESASDIIPA